jgi:hypothetical protein
MYRNSLDGWLPVDKLGQIMALIFVLGIVVCMVVGVVGCLKLFKRYLDNKIDLEETKWAHEVEREKREDENWRQVPDALQKRIKELEKTCKGNQETIANLKLEQEKKKQFMDQMKVSELYAEWRKNN